MKKIIDEYLKDISETIDSFKKYDKEGYLNNTEGVDRINFQMNLVNYISKIECDSFTNEASDEDIEAIVEFHDMCEEMIIEISFALLHNYHMSTVLVEKLFDILYKRYDYSYIINL